MVCKYGSIGDYIDCSYEELLELRSRVMADVLSFEKDKTSYERWLMKPGPNVEYQLNLEFLAKLIPLIEKRFRFEYDDYLDSIHKQEIATNHDEGRVLLIKKNTQRKRIKRPWNYHSEREWLHIINEALGTSFTSVTWDVPEWNGNKVMACRNDRVTDSDNSTKYPIPVLVNRDGVRLANEDEFISLIADGWFDQKPIPLVIERIMPKVRFFEWEHDRYPFFRTRCAELKVTLGEKETFLVAIPESIGYCWHFLVSEQSIADMLEEDAYADLSETAVEDYVGIRALLDSDFLYEFIFLMCEAAIHFDEHSILIDYSFQE